MPISIRLLALLIAASWLTSHHAQAACTGPAGQAADQFYNTTFNVMQYCNGTNWVNMGAAATSLSLAGMTDVDTTGVANGNCLVYNNGTSRWEDGACGGGSLSALSDVTITSVANNDILRYESATSKWKNVPINQAMTTTTMVPSWPDAIKCGVFVLYNVYMQTGSRRYWGTNGGILGLLINFDDAGAFTSSTQVNMSTGGTSSYSTDCDSKSITTLYSEGKAFNFLGTGAVTTFNAGTASAPGLAVTSDTDSGLYQPAANMLSITAGGTEVLRALNAASAVNYFTLTPSTGTSTVTLGTDGAGATVPITINAKGSSSITLSDAVTASAGLTVTGTATATTFSGSGASLTSLPAANLTGTLPAISGANLTSLNASNLGSGTVPAARMPALTGDVTMAAGTTTTAIAASAVTTTEILDATIANADIANATIVATTKLTATGTKDATTFLRGDNTWAAPSGGGSTDLQTFTASGTWTKPSGGTVTFIQCWGAGGSGSRNSACGVGGGGGGAYIERWIATSSLSATVTVTIGAGGPGRTTTGAGTAGGNTTFGSYVTAYGGAGGGTYNCSNVGNNGQGGQIFSAGVPGGGADEPNFWEGGDGSNSTGGNSVWGGGAGGASSSAGGMSLHGGDGGAGGPYSTGVGGAGQVPGGGGGGGYGGSGAGGNGKCIVTTW